MGRRGHGHRGLRGIYSHIRFAERGYLRQAFFEYVPVHFRKVQVDVVLSVDAPALVYLGQDGARYHVSRGEVAYGGGVALHEPFAFSVEQHAAFSPRPFGYQDAKAVKAGGVELEELHVLKRNTVPGKDAQAVARACVGVRGGPEHPPVSTRGHQCGFRVEHMERSGTYLKGDDPMAAAVAHHDIQNVEFGEKAHTRKLALLEERKEYGVPRAVGGITGTPDRRGPEVPGMPPEPPLGYLPLRRAGKGNAQVFKLHHGANGILAHDLHGVLVGQIVSALYGIVEMPFRAVGFLVAHGRADAPLGGPRV